MFGKYFNKPLNGFPQLR